jgi:hypothetical protein
MLNGVCWITGVAILLGGLYWLATAGFRNGDRPGDARVSARLVTVSQADETRPLIVATVRNPSGAPVLGALRVRAALLPDWLAGTQAVRVPRRTAGRALRPGRFVTVGVVPAGGTAELAAPVPAGARRCLLTVPVGQEGGRLRVYRLRLGPVCFTGTGRDELIMVG